ncbi:MAG: type II secretion system protein [Candidatus Riflemargulisbacteria bacterium]
MQKQKGFTFIELLIVMAILILLFVALSNKFKTMFESTKETATKANIAVIKEAIAFYYGDNAGVYPATLTDEAFKKYLPIMPQVKVTHSGKPNVLKGTCSDVLVVTKDSPIEANTDGWRYNATTGNVWVNNSQTDTQGMSYSMYGYK